MKKLIYVLSTLIVAPIIACDPVEEVKAKWMNWANYNVEKEKAKLFDYYEISSELLNDKDIQEQLREMYPSPQSDFLHLEEDPRDPLLQLAKSILACDECKNIKVKYEHSPNASVCIARDAATATCCISMHPKEHKDNNKNEIIDILLHEKSHVIYHDSEERCQILAFILEYSPTATRLAALQEKYNTEEQEYLDKWRKNRKKSKKQFFEDDVYKEIGLKLKESRLEYLEFRQNAPKNMAPYRKAKETRADVYAVIASSQKGDGLTTSFQKDLQQEFEGRISLSYKRHPHHKDRIMLLKKIKSELQGAEQEKRYMATAMQTMSDNQLI